MGVEKREKGSLSGAGGGLTRDGGLEMGRGCVLNSAAGFRDCSRVSRHLANGSTMHMK